MARGDGRVWQRGGRWWLQYNRRGKQYREPGGNTERAARAKLRARLAEIHGGTFVGPEKERTLIDKALDVYVDHLAAEGARSERTVRVHLKPIRESFGTLRVSDLTVGDVEQYKRARRDEGRAPATVNRELEALRSALRYSALPYPRMTLFELDNARSGYFTVPEIEALLRAIPDTDVRDFVAWAFKTGMRRGEARQLTWEMLDRSRPTWALRIPASITKNAKGRSFGIAGDSRTTIERRIQARRLDCPLIFHRDGRPMGPFRDLWRSALKRAQLPADRLFHDLRRSAVKALVSSGVDPLVAMKVSGHRTRSMLDRYHILEDEEIAVALKRADTWQAVPALASGEKRDNSGTKRQLTTHENWCRRWDLNPH